MLNIQNHLPRKCQYLYSKVHMRTQLYLGVAYSILDVVVVITVSVPAEAALPLVYPYSGSDI